MVTMREAPVEGQAEGPCRACYGTGTVDAACPCGGWDSDWRGCCIDGWRDYWCRDCDGTGYLSRYDHKQERCR
jgi:hypothetical protein